MPLYEYQCAIDGTFERMQKFSDPPLTTCPTCGGPVERLISAPAIQFKGTGWYVTDYARKSGGGEQAKDKPSAEKAADGASKDAAGSSTSPSAAGGDKAGSNSDRKSGSDKKSASDKK